MSPWLSELFLGSQSDERLVELARAGHDRAFVAIVQRYRRELYAHARRLGADGHAEDIVQQAFLSAFAALRKDTDVAHLRGWLYTIVRHTAARATRGRQGEAELDAVVLAGEPLEDDVDRRMLAHDALSEIGRLPERQRAALIGTAIHGHSRAEVADSLGLSEGAVRQLVHRARASLRTAVTALTPYPFARWIASVRSQAVVDHLQEAAMAAGSVSVGGAALKLGALIASGVIATGIVAVHHAKRHGHGAGPLASNAATLPGHGDGARGASLIASVGLSPFGIAGGGPSESGAAGTSVNPDVTGSGPNPIGGGGDGGAFSGTSGGGDGRGDGSSGGSSGGGDGHSSGGPGPSSGSSGTGGVGGSDGSTSGSSGGSDGSTSGTSRSTSGSSGSTSGGSGSGDATVASGTPGSDGGSSGSSSGSTGGSGDGLMSTSTSGGSVDSGSDGGSLTSGETSTSSGH